jgi:hypothetical protein
VHYHRYPLWEQTIYFLSKYRQIDQRMQPLLWRLLLQMWHFLPLL